LPDSEYLLPLLSYFTITSFIRVLNASDKESQTMTCPAFLIE